ncbi:ALP1-like protein isoform X1 [Tanacetum coccineum]
MCDDGIEQLLAQVNEFIIEELNDDTFSQLLLMLAEKELRDEAERSSRLRIQRGREEGHCRLVADYFCDEPVFPPCKFRRRFRMNKVLFMKIVDALSDHYVYFKQRRDALGIKGLSPIQKCTAAIRQLAYGTPADCNDEYIRIGESTSIECLKNFCQGVIKIFGHVYLRRPNAEDVERILHLHSEYHGFPGMLGSIDCMHWPWKNCPVSWQGQFTRGDHGEPTIMLEAVASQDLWIWHAFFGVAGSNNDINVLNQSTLFNDYLQGHSPEVRFTVNGTEYTKGYYLADGIYPEWATIVKSFPCPQDPKRKKFKEMQEAARKDVERAFGVLQSRWAIIRGAARFWHTKTMNDIIYACIIMHNMIVENEGNAISEWSDDEGDPPISVRNGSVEAFNRYIKRRAELRDKLVHNQLRSDLVQHIWERELIN